MAIQTQDLVSFLKKHPVGLVCTILALILGGVGNYRSSGIGDLEMQLEEASRKGERLKNNLRYANRLDEQMAALTRASERISERTINPGALATNLQYFYRLESEYKLKLLDLRQGTPDARKTQSAYLAVPYAVTVEGTYRQLIEFLRQLETGAHYIRFLAINVAPSRNAEPASALVTDPVIVLSLNLELLGRP
jgi:Tfp pilus assembly protein PilO